MPNHLIKYLIILPTGDAAFKASALLSGFTVVFHIFMVLALLGLTKRKYRDGTVNKAYVVTIYSTIGLSFALSLFPHGVGFV